MGGSDADARSLGEYTEERAREYVVPFSFEADVRFVAKTTRAVSFIGSFLMKFGRLSEI